MEHHVDCFVEFNPLAKECRICDALRACEQRIMLLKYNEIKGWQVMKEAIAYDAGLYAAEAAVAASWSWPSWEDDGQGEQEVMFVRDALAAIRALKEKP